jgi:prepilin-type N-terminal cleavage/methylation domain-containing protein
MKKMIKKGFSMIELLFVMVILASLAAIAIPSMSSGTDSASLTSMKSDARNVQSLLVSKFISDQDYTKVITAGSYSDANDDGFADTTLIDGTKIPLTKGNTITLTTEDCNGNGTNEDGYSISISNASYKANTVNYNSCTDGKIQLVATNL